MPDAAPASLFVLETVRTGDEVVVRCRGKLVAGVTGVLYTEVSQLIPASKKVVLDLSELTHMDSMGLGTVVRLYVSSKSGGCTLELIHLGPRIRQLLGMTNLLAVFSTVGESGITYM
jgi:anti-sigma B factor antagonist